MYYVDFNWFSSVSSLSIYRLSSLAKGIRENYTTLTMINREVLDVFWIFIINLFVLSAGLLFMKSFRKVGAISFCIAVLSWFAWTFLYNFFVSEKNAGWLIANLSLASIFLIFLSSVMRMITFVSSANWKYYLVKTFA
jgi:hypothetical protein